MVKVWEQGEVIIAEVEINASIERVFQAISDPQELVRWWGANDLYRCEAWTLELKPNTAWRCDGKHTDGTPFHVAGHVSISSAHVSKREREREREREFMDAQLCVED